MVFFISRDTKPQYLLIDFQALEVNKRLNAITEPLLDAESNAAACDSLTGEKGLLHGIPVSLKESYFLRVSGCSRYIMDFLSTLLDF